MLSLFATFTVSASNSQDFLQELFSPIEITKRVHLFSQSHRHLTDNEKQSLREAKLALHKFLKSFSNDNDQPISYISPELRKQYKNRVDLYAKEFGARNILELQIFDFLIKHNGEILFYVFLTDTSEGLDQSSQTAFGLVKINDEWNISRFSSDIKFKEAEKHKN